ncbi:Zinc/iron permease [Radiomyces spectabilis]|uniref:Zinc/iron permease n=1 Tax=Radiomyces spectabilis TaxID=64574 RepID=UPI002220A983|nr:Zinc/iron permease [Radiomyces spectabilis]KAI8379494.1 Zinc/iron permease [Radiomyces spectabilis]
MPALKVKWWIPALWMAFWTLQVQAQEASPAGEEDEANECSQELIENYDMGMRVGSLFIILGTSAIGVYAPMILHRTSPYSEGSIRDWVLAIGKFFGTGVILATAFVHMLPEAMENFESPCLTGGWLSYGAFAGVFCMLASFALQLLELAMVAHLEKLRRKSQTVMNSSISEKTDLEVSAVHADDTCHYDAHAHAGGLMEEDAFKHVGTYILELGIMMHSILIGITLANTGNSEFTTLLIALVFHQFFEGMALGTRINELSYQGCLKPVIMGFFYIIMTPIGVAIGIGIHSSFNPGSYSAVLANAILDSLSAGILLYNAYVSLMSMEISHNHDFRKTCTHRKIACFLAMYIGAGLMSLLGKWA